MQTNVVISTSLHNSARTKIMTLNILNHSSYLFLHTKAT